MGWFKDEKKYGGYADSAAQLMEEGGSARKGRKRGDLHSHQNVKTTSLKNLKDSIDTLRGK